MKVLQLWNKVKTAITNNSLLDQAIVSGGNFVVSIVLARWLGMEGFGEYVLWYMVPLFVLSMHQAFIGKPFQALLATKSIEERAVYGASLWALQLVIGSMVVLIGAVWSLIQQSALPIVSTLLAVSICGHEYIRKYAFAFKRLRLPLQVDSFLYLSLLMSIGILALFGVTEILGVFVCFFMIYTIVTLKGSCMLGLYGQGYQLRGWLSLIKEHYYYSFWLLGAALVQWVSGNGFMLAAAAILGQGALGGLRMAQQLVGICHVLFLAMENTVPVVAAQYFKEGGLQTLKKYLLKATLPYALGVGLILLILVSSGQALALGLFGDSFAAYSFLVPMYAALYVLVFLAIPLRIALRSISYTSPIFWSYVLSAGISVLLAYPLITKWHLYGVMAGLFITQVVGLLIYIYILMKRGALMSFSLPKPTAL